LSSTVGMGVSILFTLSLTGLAPI